eukprot:TRINITY_DN11435_c0_g2_i3.p1 TRINITY_DN11435_c0_g2~~TRINITY_DN11435_c0_g2_i3.p1  ORF type:complete len:290 (+),score=69.16 TRINITY_DN11435_c0_g2_i3:710-1579(+)
MIHSKFFSISDLKLFFTMVLTLSFILVSRITAILDYLNLLESSLQIYALIQEPFAAPREDKRGRIRVSEVNSATTDKFVKMIKSLCLRLGNLAFMEEQLKTIVKEFFNNKPTVIAGIVDEFNESRKRIIIIICNAILRQVVTPSFFEPLYNNLRDEQIASALKYDTFHNDYIFSVNRLTNGLKVYMRTLQSRINAQTFEIFLDCFTILMLQGYRFAILDSRRVPSTVHQKDFGRFVVKEVDCLIEFLRRTNAVSAEGKRSFLKQEYDRIIEIAAPVSYTHLTLPTIYSV